MLSVFFFSPCLGSLCVSFADLGPWSSESCSVAVLFCQAFCYCCFVSLLPSFYCLLYIVLNFFLNLNSDVSFLGFWLFLFLLFFSCSCFPEYLFSSQQSNPFLPMAYNFIARFCYDTQAVGIKKFF